MVGLIFAFSLSRLVGSYLFYATTSLLAILIGLTVVNITTPGIIYGKAAGEQLNLSITKDALAGLVEKVKGLSSIHI